MSGFNYQRYLASREWALLKQEVRERCGGICERCHVAPYQQTHHVTYERTGHEDLAGLCRPCHLYLSGLTNDDPRPWFSALLPRQQGDTWLHPFLLHDGEEVEIECQGDDCLGCRAINKYLEDGLFIGVGEP